MNTSFTMNLSSTGAHMNKSCPQDWTPPICSGELPRLIHSNIEISSVAPDHLSVSFMHRYKPLPVHLGTEPQRQTRLFCPSRCTATVRSPAHPASMISVDCSRLLTSTERRYFGKDCAEFFVSMNQLSSQGRSQHT